MSHKEIRFYGMKMPYTIVLGFVGFRVTSKLCGIGPAERSWGRVKNIKTGKRSHMSGESTEKREEEYFVCLSKDTAVANHV